MAAPKYTDRLRAQELRSLSLDEMIKIVKGDDSDFKKQLLLRLAGSVLPRLNEHSGEEGGAIVLQITQQAANKYGLSSNPSSINDTGGHPQI